MSPIDWILEHPQIILLLVGSIAWWINQRKEQKDARQDPPPDEKWPGDEGEVVDWGQGKPIASPPPLPQKTAIPQKRAATVPPISCGYQEADSGMLQHQQNLQERLRLIRAAKEATPTPVAGPVAKPARTAKTTAPAASPTGLRKRLRDPKELRRAIIMNEILGPPAALR